MSDMKNRLSRYYCQYSGILIGFALVFVFLSGVRAYPFWHQSLSSGPALVMTLVTATLFSYAAHQLLTYLNLRLFRRIGDATSTCSR